MKFKFLFASIVFCYSLLQAQEGIPVYQDYLTGSWYVIHPSTAGAASTDQARLTGRTQWFDVDDAPTLFTASMNARVNKNIGVGGIVFSDQNGNFSQNGLYGTFAYHLNLNARAYELNQLSFGLSAAVLQRKLDERSLISQRIIDPAISGTVLTDTYFNADFGMSYYKGDLYLLFTAKNILPVSKDEILLEKGLEPNNQRRFLATAGYTFSVNNQVSLEPSLMYATIPEIKEAFTDINLKTYYKLNEQSKIYGGISYRFNFDGSETTSDNEIISSQRFKAVSPFFGIDFKDFLFAYTYTNQLDEVKISNAGYHQITLGYNFRGSRSLREGVRKCNCPAFK